MCIVESARKYTARSAGRYGLEWKTAGGMIMPWGTALKTMKRWSMIKSYIIIHEKTKNLRGKKEKNERNDNGIE